MLEERNAQEYRAEQLAMQAAMHSYEDIFRDEKELRGLMAWYFLKQGNRGMFLRLVQGDSIPTVELSKAHRMAKEQYSKLEQSRTACERVGE